MCWYRWLIFSSIPFHFFPCRSILACWTKNRVSNLCTSHFIPNTNDLLFILWKFVLDVMATCFMNLHQCDRLETTCQGFSCISPPTFRVNCIKPWEFWHIYKVAEESCYLTSNGFKHIFPLTKIFHSFQWGDHKETHCLSSNSTKLPLCMNKDNSLLHL